jgi:cell division protein FtsL
MITKKKLKTKLDYEIRTFGLCALLLLIFTVFFVNPHTQDVNNRNETLEQEIEKEENLNNRLMFEQEELMIESTIKDNNH